MSGRLISARESLVWLAAFLTAAATIVLTGFNSGDPDSGLYAGLADRLSQEPVRRWLAPEWWGFWPDAQMTGLFREHPAGVFLLPAALARIGLPAAQGAYVVGLGAALICLLLLGRLIHLVTTRSDARGALVLLQLMPVAFIFRIRANHEYPMLACLLVALLGLATIAQRRSFGWGTALIAVGFTAGLFIKGVFVVLVLLGAAVWILTNPIGTPGTRTRQLAATVIALGVMVAGAVWYDAAYRAATTETFWAPYWQRQLGPLTITTPLEGASTLVSHLVFYISRLIWHPAPWTIALIAGAWQLRGRLKTWWRATPDSARRGLLFALAFAATAILVLSPPSRFAERYAFSATYAVAGAAVVVAIRLWPRLASGLSALDQRVPAFPALLWLGLALLRLVAGPLLPRL